MTRAARAAALAAGLALAVAAAPGAVFGAGPGFDPGTNAGDRDRFELGLFGGYGRGRAAGTSAFLRESASAFYSRIVASDAFAFDPASAASVGGWCTYYFSPAIGFQAGFGYFKSTARGAGEFRLEAFRDAASVVRGAWEGSAEAASVPLCLNIAARLESGSFALRVSAGPAVFLNAFLAQMPGGVEAIEPVWKTAGSPPVAVLADERLDALKVPLSAPDTTWTALGANAGAGFDVRLGRGVALSVEARYFLCPAKDFRWEWAPGVYAGLTGAIASVDFSADAARAAGRKTTALRVDPSFFQISAGLRFYFPGPSR